MNLYLNRYSLLNKKLTFSLFLIFCGVGSLFLHVEMSQASEKVKLALNWKAEPQFGGFYAAALNKEFTQRGLDVEILEGGSGTPTVQMLANNKVDFAIVSAEEIILSRQNNPEHPVTALFATYQTNPQAILTHAENKYTNLVDVLKSQEGILSAQSGLTYVAFLKQKYKGQIKTKWVPYLGGISQFLSNKKLSQQCFFNSEPLAAEKAGAKAQVFLIAESGFNPYTTVLATQSERLKDLERKKVVEKIIQAVRAGWESYLKDPEPTNKYMAQINKTMDLETFNKSARLQIKLIETSSSSKNSKEPPLGTMDLERWKTLVQQMRDLQLLKRDVPPESLF